MEAFMNEELKNGFCINGKMLHDIAKKFGKLKSLYANVEQTDGITYPTALGFVNADPQKLPNPSIEKIYTFLIDVLRFTPDELQRLSFADVFSIVQDGEIISGSPENIERVLQLAEAQRVVNKLSNTEMEEIKPLAAD